MNEWNNTSTENHLKKKNGYEMGEARLSEWEGDDCLRTQWNKTEYKETET